MKKFLVLIAVTLFAACSEEEENCCTIIDTAVSIKYLNTEGENLFEIEDGLSLADITIYHKINNEWVRYLKGNLDHPKGIYTIERDESTYLVIFPATTIAENGYSETKIEFAESDADILRTEVDKKGSNEIVTKVWYNDELKWEANQTERMFEISK